jgi:hypothetical protein
VRRSGTMGYDRAAIDAVRRTLAEQPAEPTAPGGWRSRFAFEVTVSRDPILSALPGLPGDPSVIGVAAEMTFDEVTGESELHLPLMAHARARVRLLTSRALPAPTHPTPRTTQ